MSKSQSVESRRQEFIDFYTSDKNVNKFDGHNIDAMSDGYVLGSVAITENFPALLHVIPHQDVSFVTGVLVGIQTELKLGELER